jgi:hypothetical protein
MTMRFQKTFLVAAVASAGLFGAGLQARADETTTTTTTHSESAPAGVTVGVPGVVGVHIGGDRPEGCTTKKTTHTNEDTGDSVTHKTTDCD